MTVECQNKDCKYQEKVYGVEGCLYTKKTGKNVQIDKNGECQSYEPEED